MTFGDKMRELVEQSVSVSKEFVSKAGAKAQDLGEKGVLKLEVMQLEGQAQKLIAKLGTEVYASFVDQASEIVSREDPVIKGLLADILAIRDSIELREAELKKSSANS
jgi:hypothetical protein